MKIDPKLKSFKKSSKEDLVKDFISTDQAQKDGKKDTPKYGQRGYGRRK